MAKGDKCDIPVRFQLSQQVQLLFKPMPFFVLSSGPDFVLWDYHHYHNDKR